jgi:hypothetical protein
MLHANFSFRIYLNLSWIHNQIQIPDFVSVRIEIVQKKWIDNHAVNHSGVVHYERVRNNVIS